MASLRIGLTGGIGSGKSTVAARLVALGAALVDTDAIAHALTAPGGAAMPLLRGQFGDAVAGADGALDRTRMRERIFADPQARQRLEAVLHPMIGDEVHRQADAALADGRLVVVFDVPLLAESSHWRSACDRILVVDCSIETQVRRVMRRSGWHEDQVRQVITQQATRRARRAIADAVIDNDAERLQSLFTDVDALWRWWRTGA